jgi:hypothetical protein
MAGAVVGMAEADVVIAGVLVIVAVVFVFPVLLQPATMMHPIRMRRVSGGMRLRGIRDFFCGVRTIYTS